MVSACSPYSIPYTSNPNPIPETTPITAVCVKLSDFLAVKEEKHKEKRNHISPRAKRKLVFLFVCCFVFNQYSSFFFTRLSALRQQQTPNILISLPPPVLALQRWTARYWQTKLTMLLIHIGTPVGLGSGLFYSSKKKKKTWVLVFYKPELRRERERWGNAGGAKQLIKSFPLLLCALPFSPSPSVFLSLSSISRAQTQV